MQVRCKVSVIEMNLLMEEELQPKLKFVPDMLEQPDSRACAIFALDWGFDILIVVRSTP